MRVIFAVVVASLALGGVAAAGAAAVEGASMSAATRFASTQYGYSLELPAGWRGFAATMRWPGGDIDHTAPYADTLTAPYRRLVFVIGRRTASGLDAYARAHASWLTRSRPCRPSKPMRRAVLAGSPARVMTFTCNPGVYGRTHVVKWITVRRGQGLIVTQFAPQKQRPAADEAVLAKLLRGLTWSTS